MTDATRGSVPLRGGVFDELRAYCQTGEGEEQRARALFLRVLSEAAEADGSAADDLFALGSMFMVTHPEALEPPSWHERLMRLEGLHRSLESTDAAHVPSELRD